MSRVCKHCGRKGIVPYTTAVKSGGAVDVIVGCKFCLEKLGPRYCAEEGCDRRMNKMESTRLIADKIEGIRVVCDSHYKKWVFDRNQ
jgi:hypothetical protein